MTWTSKIRLTAKNGAQRSARRHLRPAPRAAPPQHFEPASHSPSCTPHPCPAGRIIVCEVPQNVAPSKAPLKISALAGAGTPPVDVPYNKLLTLDGTAISVKGLKNSDGTGSCLLSVNGRYEVEARQRVDATGSWLDTSVRLTSALTLPVTGLLGERAAAAARVQGVVSAGCLLAGGAGGVAAQRWQQSGLLRGPTPSPCRNSLAPQARHTWPRMAREWPGPLQRTARPRPRRPAAPLRRLLPPRRLYRPNFPRPAHCVHAEFSRPPTAQAIALCCRPIVSPHDFCCLSLAFAEMSSAPPQCRGQWRTPPCCGRTHKQVKPSASNQFFQRVPQLHHARGTRSRAGEARELRQGGPLRTLTSGGGAGG